MVVLLLVVVWLVALVPVALRRFSEWQLTASLHHFQDSAGAMRRARPVTSGVGPSRPVAVNPALEAARRARERARSAALMARRRRVLVVLVSVLAGSLVLGALPSLSALWDLSLVAFAATSGYVAILVRVHREGVARAAASERREKVVSIHSSRRSAAAGALEAPSPLPPARPAFVLVDVRA